MNVQKQREEELSDTQKANTRKTSISGGEAPQRFVVWLGQEENYDILVFALHSDEFYCRKKKLK